MILLVEKIMAAKEWEWKKIGWRHPGKLFLEFLRQAFMLNIIFITCVFPVGLTLLFSIADYSCYKFTF